MNPNNNTTHEPDFEGEVMKVPKSMQANSEPTTQNSLVNGPILILLFAILVALLGGIYYWYTILMKEPVAATPLRPTAEMNNEPESTTVEARTAASEVVSTSDELDSLQADIESVNFDDLDDGFNALESELNGAVDATNTNP